MDREGTANGAGGPVERGEEPVARRVDLLALESVEQQANGSSVVLEKVSPSAVAESLSERGRSGKVDEQDRREHTVRRSAAAGPRQELLDLVEHHLDVSDIGKGVGSRDLEIPGARDPLGEPAGRIGAHEWGVSPVDHYRSALESSAGWR